MAVQIDNADGDMLQRKIETLGVSVHTSRNTILISDGGPAVISGEGTLLLPYVGN